MSERPGFPPSAVLRTMSLRRRVLHLLAGLGGGTGAVLLGLLWATEPAPLPVRTRVAFAGLIAVGLSWAGFAGWALRRMPLFALDRVVAGWLATTFSTLTAAAALAVAVLRPGPVPAGLALAGLTAVALSLTILTKAVKVRKELLRQL